MKLKPLPRHLSGILTATEWKEQQLDELLLLSKNVKRKRKGERKTIYNPHTGEFEDDVGQEYQNQKEEENKR